MKQRVITAVILLAVVIGALFFDSSGVIKRLLLAAVGFGLAYEACGLVKVHKWIPAVAFAALCASVAFTYPDETHYFWSVATQTFSAWTLAGAITTLACVFLFGFGSNSKAAWVRLLLTIPYLFFTLLSFCALVHLPPVSGFPLFLAAAIPIWCGDTAAIFAGKAFGKNKLAPSISPNKTVEGGIANLLACIFAAIILGIVLKLNLALCVVLGINCGILGQAGDLFESWLKRKADVKDSGSLLPGHGGIFDRLDSLLMTAPISLALLMAAR